MVRRSPCCSAPGDLESLEETLDLLSSPEAAQAIAEGDVELDAGQGISAADMAVEFRRA